MTKNFRVWVIGVAALVGLAPATSAQTIDLADGGADQVWTGTEANAAAGSWLDQGPVGGGDSRRDLIIGSPGATGVPGRAYVIFGGPVRSGNLSLNQADVVLTGVSAGDKFGFSTAAGNIWNQDGSSPRALIVGAPNAGAGNAGRVYLFKGGFSAGSSLTTANALLEIRGQPNDLLGYSLATADLNNDGFREMIIGAPGNNRVYVVNGGASLNHTGPTIVLDLATTAAALTITGTGGLGAVLNAGDITNDGIYDVIIGAPGANQVHVIKGRTSGVFAPAWNLLTTPADITLTGAATGDRAGASLRIADVDSDGRNDLLIGSPTADPAGRTDAGVVYMLFGPTLATLAASAPSSLGLAGADAQFLGEAANHRLGEGMTSGDINRDTPNDIVFYAPGASAAGQWLVYYGRSRSSIGQLNSANVRIVDFATRSLVDRRIVGDPARGQVAAAQVFEVTGEGARDIIVGTPTSDAGAGAVFFTISPKLRLSDNNVSVSVVVNAGQSFAFPITVKNSSTVPITWGTSVNRTWLSASPSSGSAVASADGRFYLVASAPNMAPGTYTGTLTVFSTSRDLEMSLPVTVTMRVAPATREPGDFDGDGLFDLLWQHDTQGWLSIWRLRGAALQSGESLNPGHVANTDWKVVGTGDFNNDGHPDLLWHHRTEGWVSVWFMNGLNQVAGTSLLPDRVADTNWKIVGTGDFNGDGRRDILWQHQTDRLLAVWLMNGITLIDGRLLTPNRVATTDWRIVGTGDFNRDGKTDIVWQNQANGYLSVWYMNGSTLIDGVWLTPSQVPDTNWKVRAVGDINGDGTPDLIWQHIGNGQVAAWFMNGVNQLGGSIISNVPDLGWRIVGPK